MSDLARDPVFGEVARRLQARAFASIQNEPARDELADAVTWAYVAFRRERLERDEVAAMVGHSGLFHREVRTDRGEEQHVHALVRGLRACAGDHPALAALAAAYAGYSTAPDERRLMGVVNVTPDSFSDGGNYLDPSRAVEHALRLVEEGADLLDVGGESTRPHAEPVALDEELRRVVPVIAALAKRTQTPISIDTTKSEVARAALDAGASIVNDVSAGRLDPAILAVTAAHRAGFVAMHMQGDPRTMQAAPQYGDVVADVTEHLRERCYVALEAGIERSKLWIDPGIGFGKTLEHNLELLRRLAELRSLGLPIVLGVSRKSFITKITGRETPPEQRIGGTAAALAIGVQNGAEILRVHDVAVMREAVLVARAISER